MTRNKGDQEVVSGRLGTKSDWLGLDGAPVGIDKTIVKGFRLLELFCDEAGEPLNLGYIGKISGLCKSNVSRTVKTLVYLGLVESAGAKGRYRLVKHPSKPTMVGAGTVGTRTRGD